jgi:hypothetical protein
MLKSKVLGLVSAGLLSIALIPGLSAAKTIAHKKPTAAAKTAVVKPTNVVSKKTHVGAKKHASKRATARVSHKRRVGSHKKVARHATMPTSAKSVRKQSRRLS